MLSPLRRFLKIFHPEGIPWPGTVCYNAMSATRIFQRNYELVAQDITGYCPKGSVLDVGTGPGWLLLKLHEKAPGLKLTGVDVSSSMVAKARGNIKNAGLSDSIEIREGNAGSMPFDNETFDAVVSTGSIHHWKDPLGGLNDVYRVLKPGGYALMYDLVSDTPADVLRETSHEFGRFKVFLLWIHAFEEPFYRAKEFELLPRSTLFKECQSHFVGVQCCLILKRP